MKKKMLILVGMLICISISACGKAPDNTTGSGKSTVEANSINTEKQNIESTEKVEEPTEKIEEPAESVDDVSSYNIGDKANVKDWEISVTEMKIVDTISADYGVFKPESDGNKFAQVFVTVTNNGKKAETFLPSISYGDTVFAKILYGDGYEFSSTSLLGYNLDMHNAIINPLSAQSGEIAFEIPESVVNSTDELLIRFTAGNDKVDFKLR